MVDASWFRGMWRSSWKNDPEAKKLIIGVLTFEISSLMLKLVHLWHRLSDKQVSKLKEEVMHSAGIRKLVSDDDDLLVVLIRSEIIENLGYIATSVARLGKKCIDPVWQRFELMFNDLIHNNFDPYGWEYTWKKMEKKVKKMGRFINVSSELYGDMEVLVELEQVLRRMRGRNDPNQEGILQLERKVVWRRQEVKNLQEASLWNRTYDYTVRLLARSLLTILRRFKHVFGSNRTAPIGLDSDYLLRSNSFSGLMQSSVHPSDENLMWSPAYSDFSGSSSIKFTPVSSTSTTSTYNFQTPEHSSIHLLKNPSLKYKRLAPGARASLKRCMVPGNDSPVLQSCASISISSRYPASDGGYSGSFNNTEWISDVCVLPASLSLFSSKWRLSNAPLTLGAAALALHYAYIIIIIEKLAFSPFLLDRGDRDDLYNRLPTNLRASLRTRMKLLARGIGSSAYGTDLAVGCREALERILKWLAPLAHNMVRWQSERSFEQQHLVSRTNVLLVQTLYFANQVKTEAAITELLVGLNYHLRYRRELRPKNLLTCKPRSVVDNHLDWKC